MITINDGVDLSDIDRRMWNAVAVVEEWFGGVEGIAHLTHLHLELERG